MPHFGCRATVDLCADKARAWDVVSFGKVGGQLSVNPDLDLGAVGEDDHVVPVGHAGEGSEIVSGWHQVLIATRLIVEGAPHELGVLRGPFADVALVARDFVMVGDSHGPDLNATVVSPAIHLYLQAQFEIVIFARGAKEFIVRDVVIGSTSDEHSVLYPKIVQIALPSG